MTAIQRSFIRTKEAWYADPKLVGPTMYPQEEVTLQLETPTLNGEFFIRWHPLNDREVPRLEAYDDGWGVLPYFADLLKVMETWHDKNVTPAQVCEALTALGVVDATQRQVPEHLARQHAAVARQSDAPTVPPSRHRRPR